ncbi:DUF3854 domain-containing protein [Cyanobacteria bacterium FACHB-63]|nr:DUF3854 domain-containing protein [Cyanobacteria bacterium FACHB-63]
MPSLIVSPWGDVETPIHDVLGWKYRRFGHHTQPSQTAALFNHEGGGTWQVKLEQPLIDYEKGKPRKYETPKGAGSRAYLPPIPADIRTRISARFQVDVPLEGSFWTWLEAHPQIPIVWTEGAKKGLSGLSQGFITIALTGVYGGYKTSDGLRVLTPDVVRFCQPGRAHYVAFDQDEKPKTKEMVGRALERFGSLLEATKGSVSVMTWKDEKGIDDLIVAKGVKALEAAYSEALSLCHWRIEQALRKPLKTPVSLAVYAPDLSTLPLEKLPKEGIIAFLSGKGTGKTKALRSLVKDREKVLSATFRIALGRNLAKRLGLNWRGDLDKVGGSFITGASYTFQIGFCVDSLLAINPEQFKGCDLVIDEVDQVLRHLLMSSTCATAGKRPALLARFREILKVARRVLVADADLNDEVLNYLSGLRGDESAPFLVRNDYQVKGYPVTFIDAPDRTAVTGRLMTSISALPAGKVIFVATDSKVTSQALAKIIDRAFPQKRVLVINSETSSGEIERGFIESPDETLLQDIFDVVIASPSMATGISLEAQGVIDEVFGVFTGASGTDADLAQALSRVREPVPRSVWCARLGNNFSKVSRSTDPQQVKEQLFHSTAATVRIIRANLREDTVSMLESYDWKNDPHLNLFCQLSAKQNASMHQLREALYIRLCHEGNTVKIEQAVSNSSVKKLLQETRQELQEQKAMAIANARDLTFAERKSLEEVVLSNGQVQRNEQISPKDQQAIEKSRLKEFYQLDEVTPEDVAWDNDGKRRAEILALEAQFYPELSAQRSVKSLEQQAVWNQSFCFWDVNQLEAKRSLRQKIGLEPFLKDVKQWTKFDLTSIAQTARELSVEVKAVLNFTIHSTMSDTQIVHELLHQLGLKTTFQWSRAVPGHEGEKLRVFSLEPEHWQKVKAIVDRRKKWREAGSPLGEEIITLGGDPELEALCDLLEEASNCGKETALAIWEGIPPAQQATILPKVSPTVAHLIRSAEVAPLLYQNKKK